MLAQVSVILQLTYITKFFHWEMGYMNSMDIQHDRAGFYLCWGCLVSGGDRMMTRCSTYSKQADPEKIGTEREVQRKRGKSEDFRGKGEGLFKDGQARVHPSA